jgi:AcrR family transcriptional regulator
MLPNPSRRETLKKEKRERIIAAARRVFTSRGFDGATTQEIAKQAGIATGTLFLYARDKRELLLMVFNDELESITEASIAAGDGGRPFPEALAEFYRLRFTFWGSDIALARSATADVYASRGPGEAGAELGRVHQRQERLVEVLTQKVADYAHRNGLVLREPAETIAIAIHYLYIGELRAWLCAAEPHVDDAVANLRRHFGLLVGGLAV